VAEIALFCVAAGVGEELLFRALLQQSIAATIGIVPAILITSFAFGAVHFLSATYFWLACCASVILSASHLATGSSVLVPIIAHAVYDFAAVQISLASPKPPPRAKQSGGQGV
jgi:membrane protease YdiL (CAAX protease family)